VVIDPSLMVRGLVGAVGAGLITAKARQTNTLAISGQWAAFATGIVATAAGWWWAAILIAFFVSSTALTRWGGQQKFERTIRTVPQTEQRNATQVFANGGLFTLAALGATLTGRPVFALAALGALAAATADTWSTEIGTLFGGQPRSIITWRAVAPGMSGGVTPVGTFAGLFGALLIAILGALTIGDGNWRIGTAVLLGGFGGCIADSVIGGTMQARRWCDRCSEWTERRVHPCGFRTSHRKGFYWMTNDLVNALATVTGAAGTIAVSWLLAR
jgi:uncharacterized protein (TIGR00297 family)